MVYVFFNNVIGSSDVHQAIVEDIIQKILGASTNMRFANAIKNYGDGPQIIIFVGDEVKEIKIDQLKEALESLFLNHEIIIHDYHL